MQDSRFNVRPYIRISGEWLIEHGFTIGSQFILEADGNKLILEAIMEKKDE